MKVLFTNSNFWQKFCSFLVSLTIKTACLLVMLWLFPATAVFGQAATSWDDTARPRIGLTLGGGSAGGFAHIGVLAWLEEQRIPIDALAGTSMGGLIGGCYAMGLSPAEIRHLIRSIDWRAFFDPNPPYDALDFRRKEDLNSLPLLEAGYRRRKVRLPSGLGMYQSDLILSRIALPYSTLSQFKDLPIPFQCVATDIKSGKRVVLGDGSLKEALRATMAIPGLFTPVERHGQLLVDGGVLNNVPVEILKETGAEVVIAVNIVAPAADKRQTSLDAILGQTIDTVVAHNTNQSMALADIALTPSLAELGLFRWDEVDRYFEAGYQAAQAAADELLPYALSESDWQAHLNARRARIRDSLPRPTAIRVLGASKEQAARIAAQLKPHVGAPLDTARLEKDLTRILGTGLYENISYEYQLEGEQPLLAIIIREKQHGPPFIRLGMEAEGSGVSADNFELNFRSRITAFDLAGPRSELRVDLGFGTEGKLEAELYKPLGNTAFFIAPAFFAERNNKSLFEDEDRLTDYRITDSGFRFDLGYLFNAHSQLRLGYQAGYQDVKSKVGEALPSDLDGNFQTIGFKWSSRFADQLLIPRRGFNLDLTADWHLAAPGAADPFGMADAKLVWHHPVKQRDSLVTLLSGGVTFEGNPPWSHRFSLGGPFRLSTYSFDTFQDDNYLLGLAGYFKSIRRLSTGKEVYLGIWLEHGGVFANWSDLQMQSNLSLGLITGTLLGPLTLGSSSNEDGDLAFFAVLGRLF